MHKNRLYLLAVVGILLIGALALGACGGEAELGTEENPIVWAFVPSGETERVAAGSEAVADLIFEETGLYVDTFVATEYAGVIEAMCADPPKAHVGSLATFAYILASDQDCAEAELVSVRFGSPTYNGQIFVHADSAYETLADLDGVSFCRADALSTSGWVIPSIDLAAAGVTVEPVDAGSHDAAVAGVYNGDCEAGSSYVDARGTIEEEHPDVMDVVKVIHQSVAIPNDGVQYSSGVTRELRDVLNAAMLAIIATEEGEEAFNTAYSWSALEPHDDTFYDPFRQLLDAAGINAADLQ
jgi:phosphonate transport system substrate-binding protein